ncbi:MAG: PQQ-like beta-propeller repeat protein [Planctomycetes bacterium]|nr:PQQ-like beta-propeller repeat protein [Planctomycetota bacterium]
MAANRKIVILPAIWALLLCSMCAGADWPQFRGIDRDGKSAETGLLKRWPVGGPKLLWEVDGLGDGYSSAAISRGTVYTTGMTKGQEFVFAFDLNGGLKWKICYGTGWAGSYRATRSTPTVDGDRFYLFSGVGEVYCFDAASGDIIWSLDVFSKYKGKYPLWGMSENILVDGDNIICTPGGAIASVVALDKMTGSVVWECTQLSEESTYCNPRVFEMGPNRIIATMLRDSVVGIDAKTGKLLWADSLDGYHTDRKRAVNANVPIFHEGRIYTTSGYDNGGAMLQLSPDGSKANRIWTDTTLDVHHGGVMLIDGYLYGSNWRSNSRGDWACIRWSDGKTMYDTEWNGNKGSLIYAEGMLYCYDENDGDVALVRATPAGFTPVSSFKITKGKGKFWAHPSISDGRLYIRHGDYLMAYDIKNKR